MLKLVGLAVVAVVIGVKDICYQNLISYFILKSVHAECKVCKEDISYQLLFFKVSQECCIFPPRPTTTPRPPSASTHFLFVAGGYFSREAELATLDPLNNPVPECFQHVADIPFHPLGHSPFNGAALIGAGKPNTAPESEQNKGQEMEGKLSKS